MPLTSNAAWMASELKDAKLNSKIEIESIKKSSLSTIHFLGLGFPLGFLRLKHFKNDKNNETNPMQCIQVSPHPLHLSWPVSSFLALGSLGPLAM